MLKMVRRTALLASAALWAFTIALFAPVAALNSPRLRRVLLAVTVLNIPIPVEVHLGFQEDSAGLGSFSGFLISLTTIALPLLYAPLLMNARRYPSSTARSHVHISTPLALYLLISVLSLTVARDVTVSMYEIFLFFQMFLLYHYIANWITSREDVLLIVRFLLIGLILESVLIIAQANHFVGDIDVWGVKTRLDEGIPGSLERAGGTIGSPNQTASYLGIILTLAIGLLLARVEQVYKYLAAAGLVLGAVALVLTFTRGGWIAFLVSFVILLFVAPRRIHIPRKVFVTLAVVPVLTIVPFFDAIQSRITSDDQGAAYARVPLMKLAALIIRDNPLLGVGDNNFALAMQPYVTRGFSGEWIYTVHNKYLIVWAEVGTFGLLAFLWFLTSAIGRGWNCWERWDPFFSPVALGCTAALIGHMLHMFVDTFRGRPITHLVWLIAGLLVAIQRMRTIPVQRLQELNGGVVAGTPCQSWRSYS